MNGGGGFPGGVAFRDRPGAILLAADGKKTDVTAFLEGADDEGVGVLQFVRCGDHDRLVGREAMGGHRGKVLGTKAGGADGAFVFQLGLEFLQHGFLNVGRITAQARFDKFEILQQEIRQSFAGGEQNIGVDERFFADDIDLGVNFFVGFDEFMYLIKTRVFDVVFAQNEALDAKRAYFHESVPS